MRNCSLGSLSEPRFPIVSSQGAGLLRDFPPCLTGQVWTPNQFTQHPSIQTGHMRGDRGRSPHSLAPLNSKQAPGGSPRCSERPSDKREKTQDSISPGPAVCVTLHYLTNHLSPESSSLPDLRHDLQATWPPGHSSNCEDRHQGLSPALLGSDPPGQPCHGPQGEGLSPQGVNVSALSPGKPTWQFPWHNDKPTPCRKVGS